MTYRVGPKGQVVLPKRIRDRLGIEPGDQVDVDERDGEIVIRRAAPVRLLGMLKDLPGGGTEALLADRRAELAREEQKIGRLRS